MSALVYLGLAWALMAKADAILVFLFNIAVLALSINIIASVI